MMKKIFYLIILLFTCAVNLTAHVKFDPEKFKAELHQYIIISANLSEQEAACFLSLYDAMQSKQRVLHKQIRQYQKSKPTNNTIARNTIIRCDDLHIQMKRIEKEYHLKMLKVLSAVKLNEALKAARKFHRQYFRKNT